MTRAKQTPGERLSRLAAKRLLVTSSLSGLAAEIDAAIAAEVKRAVLVERRAAVADLDAALAKHDGVDVYGLRMARGIVRRRGRALARRRVVGEVEPAVYPVASWTPRKNRRPGC